MFSTTHKAALRGVITGIPGPNRLQILSSTLPDNYTLSDLDSYLASIDHSKPAEKLAALDVLYSSLHDERLKRSDDSSTVTGLCNWLTQLLMPDAKLFVQDHPDYTDDDRHRALWREALPYALSSLALLLGLHSDNTKLNSKVLLSLLAFTNHADAWSSKEVSETALTMVSRQLQRPYRDISKFIIQDILRDYIRPLFINSKPDTVTEQGRKVTVDRLPNERHSTSHLFDPVKKPWKFQDVGSITIFRWAVAHTDKELMSRNWHLFIPPVLTLLDDPSTQIRLSGMATLSDLLDKVPPKMLGQTGLGDVIEEALIPTLSFLPTLTPVDESLLLLNAAYDTLLKLTDVRFEDHKSQPKRQKVLDKLLLEGVLHGMDHCQQNGEIVRLSLTVMEKLINRSEIHSIKHLKDTTPVLYTLLMDPFAPTNSDNLVPVIRALQAIVLNCWPVLSEDRHRIELLKVMSVCWLHLNKELQSSGSKRDAQLEEAKHQLKITADLLSRSMPDEGSFINEVKQLVCVEPQLASLFLPGEGDSISV